MVDGDMRITVEVKDDGFASFESLGGISARVVRVHEPIVEMTLTGLTITEMNEIIQRLQGMPGVPGLQQLEQKLAPLPRDFQRRIDLV